MPVITSKGFPEQLRRGLEQKCGLSFLEPINSVGVKVGYMVRRLADIYLNHHPVRHWDTCAPLVILEEAGGRMTHWDGTPLSFEGAEGNAHPHPTVATNGVRHDELISLLSSFPKP
jgi:3'(2'), 5'-bisphosphate nucleotidase